MKCFVSVGAAFGAAAIVTSAASVGAFAQATPMSNVPGGKNVTCAAFLDLSPAAARDVLYFANGYAAGVEDQIASGTPSSSPPTGTGKTPAESATVAPKSSNLAALATIGMDQLRAVCQASPKATVLSVVPGGRPVSGSGTISGGTATGGTPAGRASGAGGGGNIGGAVTDTTGALSAGSPGTSAAGAAGEAPSAPTAVTTPGSTTTNPATGIVTPRAGSTTLPAGGARGGSTGGTVAAPSPRAPVGGELASPGVSPGGTGGSFGGSTAGSTPAGSTPAPSATTPGAAP